jgi:hypothetical protein
MQTTFLYCLTDATPQAQAELSYSILSALKHAFGQPDPSFALISKDTAQRQDLPVRHISAAPTDPLHALQLAAQEIPGNLCFLETCTVFRSSPASLADRISDAAALLYAADSPGRWNTGVIGLAPSLLAQLEEIRQNAQDIDTALAQETRIETCSELILNYKGYRQRLYHARFAQLFPAGHRIENVRAQAATLPKIKDPPVSAALKLRARAFALRTRATPAVHRAYLAYLCSLSAPTDLARSVWAGIALDRLSDAAPQPDTILRAFEAYRPENLPASNLPADLQQEWSVFWQTHTHQGTSFPAQS